VLLQRQIRFEILAGGFDAFVAQPERDRGDVDTRLKQVHRGGVSTMSMEK
jgi:hypothetical protein